MDRRTFAGGMAAIAGLAAGGVRAGDFPLPPRDMDPMAVSSGDPLFTNAPLSNNIVARDFGIVPALKNPPEITYVTADGETRFSELTGKTRLLALWAEWCPPCMTELAELAVLQTKYGGERFEVIAVLTGSSTRMGFNAARKAVDDAGAGALPLMIERNGGSLTLSMTIPVKAMSPESEGRTTIPCVLLVDETGAVRGRIIGLKSAPQQTRRSSTPPQNSTEKVLKSATTQRPLAPNETIGPSVWTTSAAEDFVQALLDGALKTAA